jgi:NAD-dependent dihydropyrimidine dehydrogenase PreA subunit
MMAFPAYLRDVVTLKLDEGTCTGCGMCLEVCPHAVLGRNNGRVRVQARDACMECGACARNCPVQAITVRTGVGCAMAVVNSALGRDASSCCCVIESADSQTACSDRPQASGATGCC